MQKLLTIVVPTYNMEVYLPPCLSSLVVDDVAIMDMLEVLVVNDGSTDRSSEIAHGYESRYPYTFKVIDKENGNYGSCINAALPVATGKYIKVLDADDWFDTDVLLRYIRFLENCDVDAVISDFDRVDTAGKYISTCSYAELPHDHDFFLSDMTMYFHQIWMHAVTYRTELLRRIDYLQSEGISYSDQEWIFLPMAHSKILRYFPQRLYKYVIGREGQTINKDVWEKNFWMEIQGTQHMLEDYSSDCSDADSCYMRERLITRINTIYHASLIRFSSSLNDKAVRKFDKELKQHHSELYIATDNANITMFRIIRFPYVRLWRWGLSGNIVRFLYHKYLDCHACITVVRKISLH